MLLFYLMDWEIVKSGGAGLSVDIAKPQYAGVYCGFIFIMKYVKFPYRFA
jgi:hypothetical protein